MAAAGWHGVEGNAPTALRDESEHSPCKSLFTVLQITLVFKRHVAGRF